MVRALVIATLLAGCATPPPGLTRCEQLALDLDIENPASRRAMLDADCSGGSTRKFEVRRRGDGFVVRER